MNRAEAEKLVAYYRDAISFGEGVKAAREAVLDAMTRGEAIKTQRDELLKALGHLSFSCFAGIGLQKPPTDVYNETFLVLQRIGEECQREWASAPLPESPAESSEIPELWSPDYSMTEPTAESQCPHPAEAMDGESVCRDCGKDLGVEPAESKGFCEDCPPLICPADQDRCTECPLREVFGESREVPEAEVERQAGRVE